MKKQPEKKTIRMRLAMFLTIFAGAATLLPWPAAGAPSILGYNALCPFSPISTGILLFTANLIHGHIRRVNQRH
ncbi:MAG: hypothetical protein MI863_09215 [Desulfobacterales bacterium]|nr:hypothetical protein [Desulfobacterales bacterium]